VCRQAGCRRVAASPAASRGAVLRCCCCCALQTRCRWRFVAGGSADMSSVGSARTDASLFVFGQQTAPFSLRAHFFRLANSLSKPSNSGLVSMLACELAGHLAMDGGPAPGRPYGAVEQLDLVCACPIRDRQSRGASVPAVVCGACLSFQQVMSCMCAVQSSVSREHARHAKCHAHARNEAGLHSDPAWCLICCVHIHAQTLHCSARPAQQLLTMAWRTLSERRACTYWISA
jgi:hypothetical protein